MTTQSDYEKETKNLRAQLALTKKHVKQLQGKVMNSDRKIEEMKEEHRKDLLESQNAGWREKEQHDITRRNFEMLSSLKMEDLLELIMAAQVQQFEGSGVPYNLD